MSLPKRPKRRSAAGFTLLELMLVVGIIGILATLGVGFSGTFIKDQRLKACARAVQSAISMARADAVRASTISSVAVASNTIYAFRDLNKNGVYDGNDLLLYQYPQAGQTPLPQTTRLYVQPAKNGAAAPSNSALAGFNFEGLYLDSTGTPASLTICVKDSTLVDVRAVQMSITGSCRTLGMAAGAAACP